MSEIQEHLAGLTDADLIACFEQAKADLAEAAAEQPESEWHQACFAGLLTYAQELMVRGLRVAPLH